MGESHRSGLELLFSGQAMPSSRKAQALESYRPECHSVPFSSSLKERMTSLLYIVVVSLHVLLFIKCLVECLAHEHTEQSNEWWLLNK